MKTIYIIAVWSIWCGALAVLLLLNVPGPEWCWYLGLGYAAAYLPRPPLSAFIKSKDAVGR